MNRLSKIINTLEEEGYMPRGRMGPALSDASSFVYAKGIAENNCNIVSLDAGSNDGQVEWVCIKKYMGKNNYHFFIDSWVIDFIQSYDTIADWLGFISKEIKGYCQYKVMTYIPEEIHKALKIKNYFLLAIDAKRYLFSFEENDIAVYKMSYNSSSIVKLELTSY